ncbi:MAG: ion channel protein, partial [Bacteroidota bacterium]
MMKTLLTLLGLVFFGTSWAADAASFYKQGNELYANGKYQDAVIAYTEALKFTDVAELHYNLGNA